MKIGDIVIWEAYMRGVQVEKCGRVFQVVPPRTDPRKFVPQGFNFSSKTESRPEFSVLVQIPKINTIYWPEHPILVPRTDEYKMYTQPVPASMKPSGEITNDYDRYRIKEIFKLAGNEFAECEAYISNITAGIRLWFSIDKDGVEYVSEVEKFGIGALMTNRS